MQLVACLERRVPSRATQSSKVALPGSEEIQAFLGYLTGLQKGPYTFEQAATGNFTFITKQVFDAIAASDSNPQDGLLDPSTAGNPKLLALVVQTQAALANPADAALLNSTTTAVNTTIAALQAKIAEATNGPINDFYGKLQANIGQIDPQTLQTAWKKVQDSFRVESVKMSIYDSINALDSGLLQAEQSSFKASFDLIKSQLHAVDANYRLQLAKAIATVHVSNDVVSQLNHLTDLLNNPSNSTSSNALILANKYLQAQVAAFGAPRTSDYLVATLLGSGKLSQTQLDQFTKGNTTFTQLWTGTNPNSQLTFDLLKKYDSSFTWTSITQGDFNAFINTRLSCELGNCNLPDNVSDNVLDIMTLLAAQNLTQDAILLYYSSVANQIRQENPDYLSRYYSTDAQLATYSFKLYKIFSDFDDVAGTDQVELSNEDVQFLLDMIYEQQLDMSYDQDKKVLEDAITARKIPQGLDKGDYVDFTVISTMDPTVGQQSNLRILAATANQAYRTFDSNNQPLIQNPFFRANRLASRLSLNYSFTFDVQIESICMDDWCPSNEKIQLTQDQNDHLVSYILQNNLDNLGVEGQAKIDLNTRVTNELLAYSPSLDKLTVVEYTTTMNLGYYNASENYPDNQLSSALCQNQQICIPQLKDLIPVADQVMQGIKNGTEISINENSNFWTSIGSFLPGFSLLFSLSTKPKLNGRQQFVRDWLNEHGRSTQVLDSALEKAKSDWKTDLIMNAAFFAIEVGTFVVPELVGLAAAVRASEGTAVASFNGIRLENMLNAFSDNANVVSSVRQIRTELSESIPSVPTVSSSFRKVSTVCKLLKRELGAGCAIQNPSDVMPDTVLSSPFYKNLGETLSEAESNARDVMSNPTISYNGYETELAAMRQEFRSVRMMPSQTTKEKWMPQISKITELIKKETKVELTDQDLAVLRDYEWDANQFPESARVELFKKWPVWNTKQAPIFRLSDLDTSFISNLKVGDTVTMEKLTGNSFLAASRRGFIEDFRSTNSFEMVFNCKNCKWIAPLADHGFVEDEVIAMGSFKYLGRKKVAVSNSLKQTSTWRLYFDQI